MQLSGCVRHQKVIIAVAVDVGCNAAKSEQRRGWLDDGHGGDRRESRMAIVLQYFISAGCPKCEVEFAIVVEIGHGAAQGGKPSQCRTSFARAVDELVVSEVLKEDRRAVIAEEDQVRITVAIKVGKENVAEAAANPAEPGNSRDVGKRTIAVVAIKVDMRRKEIIREPERCTTWRRIEVCV